MPLYEKSRKLGQLIFYKAPLTLTRRRGVQHHHLVIFWQYMWTLFLVFWITPWMLTLVWHSAVIVGCTSYATRNYLEDFCMGPYLSQESKTPWYLDLWDTQGNLTDSGDAPLPAHIESIMIGSTKICDTEIALRREILKIQTLHPNNSTNKIPTRLRE